MKVLVIGHRGMLGQALLFCLRQAGFLAIGQGRPEVDIAQAASVQRALTGIRPEILINAAAYTAVDRAESEPELAWAVNRDGAAHLAAACRVAGIPLLHVSTDYVFDGTASRPYREDDATAPLGVYGRSKWAGEEAVRARHQQHLIVRTAWLYDRHGSNFVTTMLRLARARETLRVVADQQGGPTWSRDLAAALVGLCQRLRQDETTVPWGTYHFSGAGQTTWHGFAEAIIEAARAYEPLAVRDVLPIPTTDYPTPARRPAYAVLDCTRMRTAFGITPHRWRESLQACIQELYTCPATTLATS